MRYEEWINLELFYKPNEVYDRSFDDFCDEIESCDFDSMIRNCADECIDREENPERYYQALYKHLHEIYDNNIAQNEYRKVLWYLQHKKISVYDFVDINGKYDVDLIDAYYQNHDIPTSKMWTEYLTTLDDDIGGIKEFVASLNNEKGNKHNEKDNVKSK